MTRDMVDAERALIAAIADGDDDAIEDAARYYDEVELTELIGTASRDAWDAAYRQAMIDMAMD